MRVASVTLPSSMGTLRSTRSSTRYVGEVGVVEGAEGCHLNPNLTRATPAPHVGNQGDNKHPPRWQHGYLAAQFCDFRLHRSQITGFRELRNGPVDPCTRYFQPLERGFLSLGPGFQSLEAHLDHGILGGDRGILEMVS